MSTTCASKQKQRPIEAVSPYPMALKQGQHVPKKRTGEGMAKGPRWHCRRQPLRFQLAAKGLLTNGQCVIECRRLPYRHQLCSVRHTESFPESLGNNAVIKAERRAVLVQDEGCSVAADVVTCTGREVEPESERIRCQCRVSTHRLE